MNIESTLTLQELHQIVEDMHLENDEPTVDDLLVAVANAAARRAVEDLMYSYEVDLED